MASRSESLNHVSFLLKEGLLRVYPYEVPDPNRAAVLFFDAVPDQLLEERKETIDKEQGVREWFLVVEEPDPEWTESLRGDCGVLVIEVDDLDDARRSLLPFVALGRWSTPGSGSAPESR